jgi:hypothetical protein
METLVWIGIAIACFIVVWLTGPYHQRLIDNQHTVAPDMPDEVPPRASGPAPQ